MFRVPLYIALAGDVQAVVAAHALHSKSSVFADQCAPASPAEFRMHATENPNKASEPTASNADFRFRSHSRRGSS